MSTPAPRRPRPPKRPETLVELVLDLEERSPGEPDAAIELPAQEWAHLVVRAQQEATTGYRPGAVSDPAPAHGLLAVDAALSRFDELRNELAKTLGWGPLNGAEDLLQVVRGYVMALDEEREANEWPTSLALESEAIAAASETARKRMVKALGIGVDTEWADVVQIAQGYAMALDVERERAVAASDAAAERVEQIDDEEEPACQTLKVDDDGVCANCGRDPEAHADPGPTMLESLDKEEAEERTWLAAAALRRLNGAGWKRAAKKARETNSSSECHHCGYNALGKDEGGLSAGPDLPEGVFCAGCCVRLRADPGEFQERQRVGPFQVHVDGAPIGTPHKDRLVACAWARDQGHRSFTVTWANGETCDIVDRPAPKAKAKPTRATKKFPLAAGPERCTKCGRTQGAHDGTKCPPQAHGDHPDDELAREPGVLKEQGREYNEAEGRTFWDGTGFTTPPASAARQVDLNEAIAVAGSLGGEGTEVYCRSCKAFFPAGTHTHAAAPKGRKQQKAQAELADQ